MATPKNKAGAKKPAQKKATKQEVKEPIQTDILSELEQTQKDVEGVGVGDIIAKVTKATGLDKVVAKFVKKTGIDCGCEDRKKRWNGSRLFQKLSPECLTEEEFKYLKSFFKTYTNHVSTDDQQKILPIYNRVFRRNQEQTTCTPCWITIIDTLESVYKHY